MIARLPLHVISWYFDLLKLPKQPKALPGLCWGSVKRTKKTSRLMLCKLLKILADEYIFLDQIAQ